MANYIELDFNSFKESMKNILKSSDTFKDYNFEGANITMLLELLSYMMEMNTYYQNKIVENMYMDTATLYNTVHRLADHKGYTPKGHISAYATLTVEVSGGYADTQFYIPEYSVFKTEENDTFVTTKDYTINVPASAGNPFIFDIGLKEGQHERLTYTGKDLVDYSIILPAFAYDNDENTLNDEESAKVYVNGTQWTRVDNFFERVSGLSADDNIYTFHYNKYKNYVISFSSTRNYPAPGDDIVVDLIRTSGEDGSTGSNLITKVDDPFITDLSTGDSVLLDNIVITNTEATRWASGPETIPEIKVNSNANINSQYRCVTKSDFRTYLEERNDIVAANVWGEQEIAPSGNVQEYNNIYISLVPDNWKSSTITTTTSGWTPVDDTINIYIPYEYSNEWKSSVSEYLEPRRMLNIYENYKLPDLIYFYFELGIVTERMYNFNNVANEIKDKIVYFFDAANRNFNEIIDFRTLSDYIKDTSEVSANNSFSKVAGIKSITFRDIMLSSGVYDYQSDKYPQYTMKEFGSAIDNILRPIKLGLNQFPMITKDSIVVNNEG